MGSQRVKRGIYKSRMCVLSHFSGWQLFVTPWTVALQAPLSMGFSRKQYWSGLPFPSPTHESEKWKWSHSVVSYSLRPHRLQPARLLCPWDSPGNNTGVDCYFLLQAYEEMLKNFQKCPGPDHFTGWILPIIQRRRNTHLSQAPPKNLKEHFLTHFTRPKLHWYQIWTRITQNSTDLADWKMDKDRVINYLLMDITECDILWIVNMHFLICSQNTQKKFTLYLAKKTTDHTLIIM